MHFMPVEVAAHRYLFTPTIDSATLEPLDYMEEADSISWTYNHTHDLESLWWVATWIVANNYFSTSGDSHSDLCGTPESLRVAFFPPTVNPRRQNTFVHGFSWRRSDIPQTHRQAFRELNSVRLSLTKQYRKIQSTLPYSLNLDASDERIYKVFKDMFETLQLVCIDYTLISFPQLRAEIEKLKREREDDINHSSKRRAVD